MCCLRCDDFLNAREQLLQGNDRAGFCSLTGVEVSMALAGCIRPVVASTTG